MAKKKDVIPEDINAELTSPNFGKSKLLTNTGYVLDVNENDKKIDIQLYEPIAGTTILEGLDLSKNIKLNDLEKGIACEFKLDELKAQLSKKTVESVSNTHLTMPTSDIL